MRFKVVTMGAAVLTAASLAMPVGTSLATTGDAYPSCVGGRCSSAATKAIPPASANAATATARSLEQTALIRHQALGRLGPPLPGASHTNPRIRPAPPAVADGFDLGPAAIGAAAVVGLIAIAGTSMALRRRRSVVVQSASRS